MEEKNKIKIFLMHGWGGTGKMGWFQEIRDYAEKRNIEIIAPNFPNTENPQQEEWLDFFEKNISLKIDEETIFVGHSLGPSFFLRYLSENDLKINDLILVAPVYDNKIEKLDSFFTKEVNWEKVKQQTKNISIICSDNDPYIPENEFREIAKKLKAQLFLYKNREHFSQNKNTNPEVLELLKKVIQNRFYKEKLKKWSKVKYQIQADLKDIDFYYNKQEVWWMDIGQNIGFEQNGKGDNFSRPVLVYKKFNKNMFWGIPLTSQKKTGKYFFSFKIVGKTKNSVAILSQLRLFDSRRMQDKIGFVSQKDFLEIKKLLINLLDE